MTRPSFVNGAGAKPLIYQTIGNVLREAVERFPQREALVVRHQDIRWTYAELLQRVDDLAAGLIALGFVPGDRVGIWAPNCAEWVLTQFATARAGLILVNINPAYRTHELEYALNKVACKRTGHRLHVQEQRLPGHAGGTGAGVEHGRTGTIVIRQAAAPADRYSPGR